MKDKRLIELLGLTKSLVRTLGDQITNLSWQLEESTGKDDIDHAMFEASLCMSWAGIYLEDAERIIAKRNEE